MAAKYKLGMKVRNRHYTGEYTVIKVYTMETVEYTIYKYKIKSGVEEERRVGNVSVEHEMDEIVLDREYDIVSEPEIPDIPEPEKRLNRLDQI